MRTPGMKSGILAVAVAALVGCATGPQDPTEASDQALLDGIPTAHALPTVDAAGFVGAADGCEGHLTGIEDFAITAPDALVAAFVDGTALCVDTLGSIEIELATLGEHGRAEAVRTRFYDSLDESAIAMDSGRDKGDPNPQPSGTAFGPDPQPSKTTEGRPEGDPNPQPSRPTEGGTTEGDPNPQPSCPTESSPVLPPVFAPVSAPAGSVHGDDA